MHERNLGIQVESVKERQLETDLTWSKQKKIRVYIDYENQKYYIDMSAAFALKLISRSQWIKNDEAYYEITSRKLNEFEQMYEIVYEYFDAVDKKEIILDDYLQCNLQNQQYKTNVDELKELRNELVEMNRNIEMHDYKDSNDIDGFMPKK